MLVGNSPLLYIEHLHLQDTLPGHSAGPLQPEPQEQQLKEINRRRKSAACSEKPRKSPLPWRAAATKAPTNDCERKKRRLQSGAEIVQPEPQLPRRPLPLPLPSSAAFSLSQSRVCRCRTPPSPSHSGTGSMVVRSEPTPVF